MLGRNKPKMMPYEEYVKEREFLQKQITALQTAFDAFFDVVAADLGYEAAQGPFADGYWIGVRKCSPRQLAKTAPTPEIIRHQTARCRGKERK